MMTKPIDTALLPALTCPLCHTVDRPATSEAFDAGSWKCTRCGQIWSARRLATVAAYARFETSRGVQ